MGEPTDSYAGLRESITLRDGAAYPAASFVDLVLEPGYARAKARLIEPMVAINKAHLLMLAEVGILPKSEAADIMRTILSIDYSAYRMHRFTGRYEDLFFELESEIIRRVGEAGGNLHLARSRNDMCLCMTHMALRTKVLALIERQIEAQNVARLFAMEHRDTLFVAHTHTQHAQPSLVGHYFLGVVDVIDRDVRRLRRAYEQVNNSPLGAAAITTSGFPIDRARTADLLGFDGFIENSYDAIGNPDCFTETAAAISLAALNLGRVVHDMLLWATEEISAVRVADGYISTSSIMPQKRNPIAFEHLRSILSTVKGAADTVMLVFHNTPYGDIVDYEDAEPHLWQCADTLSRAYTLFASVVGTMEVNRELLARRAHESFSVVTELADALFREGEVPFRKAHHIVASLVKSVIAEGKDLGGIDERLFLQAFKSVTGEEYRGSFATIRRSLDPSNFVAVREAAGGTGPRAMAEMFSSARDKVRRNSECLEKDRLRLSQAQDRLNALSRQLASPDRAAQK